ncbi:hypothetical protein FA15DRAFT_589713 [Coprinopsis marcescibilis]|uniref:Apple domain-containing protein n=1 Tax=Coprinopsis marcescibilis TaxID=230819 RepID=A0A5C3L149_COPMA|nr:hypothetical protein FA15DRAFT_589713 [Coprinopsis marcescibilis]
MKFSTLLTAALAVGVAAVAAVPQRGNNHDDDRGGNDRDFGRGNHYGAGPRRPWERDSGPGWYFGRHPNRAPRVPCLRDENLCRELRRKPRDIQCPNPHPTPSSSSSPAPTSSSTPNPGPSDGYTQTFANLSGATQTGSYLTYGLVDTIDDCKAMCNSVEGCAFANTYRDVNGKGGSLLLTCSLFGVCQGPESATNVGGQSQPDGSINYIANSDGWCKSA